MRDFTFDDVLLVPQLSDINSRKDVDLGVVAKNNVYGLSLPVFSSNMDTITESGMAIYIRSKGGAGVLHRFMSIERNVEEYKKSPNLTFMSVGVGDKEYDRFLALFHAGARNFCVDVAHGHSKQVANMINRMKNYQGKDNIIVMAGNVCTFQGTEFLRDSGADLVKVGIGPGSVCSTRIKTGHGMPQLSAIQDCAGAGISIVADGGIRTPGDIVKALAFGADFVMLGSMLAGTHYTPGVMMMNGNAKLSKNYRGMASKEVAEENGGLSEWKTAEGISTSVPYRNEKETEEIMQDIIGGIRSGLSYSGCRTIKELQEKVRYVTITNNSLIESYPHKK